MFLLGIAGIIAFSYFATEKNIDKRTIIGKNLALQTYPSGLVLDISPTSGVTTNTTGPVIFSIDRMEWLFSWIDTKSDRWHKWYQYKNIFVIDTQGTWDVYTHETYALLTNTQLIIQVNDHETRVYDIASTMKNNQPLHVTQASFKRDIEDIETNITSNANKISHIAISIVVISVIILLILWSFIDGLCTAILLYIYAIPVRIISKILWKEYSYKQAYSMSILWFTLPSILRWCGISIKVLVLCIIVWRIIYRTKQWNKASHNL